MEIDVPKWHLKQTCPVCEQGNCLTLIACPNCGHLISDCAECGAIFPTTANLKLEHQLSADAACPVCQKIRIADFQAADSARIQAAGILPSCYC